MKNFIKTDLFVVFLFYLGMVYGQNSVPNSRDSLVRSIVSNEIANLFNLTNIRCPYNYSENTRNISTKTEGITLGLPYLGNLLNRQSRSDFLFSLRFILAHELAHQIQFINYVIEEKGSCEERRLYECQADIIGGIILGRLYDQMNENKESDLMANIMNGIEFVYDIGEPESGVQYHPNPIQRRNAIRYGLSYSLKDAKHYGFIAGTADIDLHPGEDSLGWSLRIAKLIIHYPLKLVLGLFCTYSRINWDTTLEHPFVQYDEKFYNPTNRSLRLNIAYEVCGVRSFNHRMIPDTSPKHTPMKGAINYISEIIPPKTEIRLNGELRWRNVSDSSFMPRMILNTDDDGLYNVEAVNVTQESRDIDDDRFCLDSFADKTAKEKITNDTLQFYVDLEQVCSNLIADEWPSMENGFGMLNLSLVTYTSKIKFPYAISNQISLDTGRTRNIFNGYYSMTFFRGKDKDSLDCFSVYRKMLSLVKSYYKDQVKWTEDTVRDDDIIEVENEAELPKSKIIVSLYCRIAYGNSTMTMSIKNPPIPRQIRRKHSN